MSQRASGSSDEPAWLVVDHPDGSRDHVRLALSLTTVGRSEGNVLELLDPKLSRFHCEVERKGSIYWLRDCNSRNGTLLNGAPVSSPRLLDEGDQVRVGNTLLSFHRERPAELRRDTAVALIRPSDEEATTTDVGELEPLTPALARRRPTEHLAVMPEAPSRLLGADASPNFDPRRTQPITGVVPRERTSSAWRLLGEAARGVLAARTRAELLECAVRGACELMQARGALLGQAGAVDPEELVVVASEGLDAAGLARCQEVGRRVLQTRAVAFQDSRALGVPLCAAEPHASPRGPGEAMAGALVLHDLPRQPGPGGSDEVAALEVFAGLVGRTLLGGLQLEEVRREERQSGARRVAQDLLPWLRPGQLPASPLLDLGLALAPGVDVGSELWDAWPERGSGRPDPSLTPSREAVPVWLLWGDVPGPGATPPAGLRRGGERALFGLTAQAELRGAVRALCEVFPGPGDVLQRVHRGARAAEGPARPPLPAALLLLRCDPASGALTFAGGGHEALVLWRARHGSVELWTAAGPVLGSASEPDLRERELAWEPGDVLLLLSAGAARAAAALGEAGGGLSSALGRAAVAEVSAPRVARRIVDELGQAAGSRALEGVAVLVVRRV